MRSKYPLKTSVIIPTYYRIQDLACLFDSLLKQLVKPDEVLVVDDTPTTDIRSLCEKYSAEFNKTNVTLVYIKNPRERSISIARNLGAEMARGEIFLFVDSDVILYPDYIEKILAVFKKNPSALGVSGWVKRTINYQLSEGVRFHFFKLFTKLFFLWHFSSNSCKYFEIPLELTCTTNSQYLNGQSLSVKNSVFNEIQFDENLKGYSWMEDFLFTASIYKKHHKGLLITPEAMFTHSMGAETRLEGKSLIDTKKRNRKYVQIQLWGSKGLLMFGWQNLGIMILKVFNKIRNKKLRLILE
jgi:GT2 family glycosyltransferase